MKAVLLHGPAIDASRKKLSEIKDKFEPENIMVFEKGAEPAEILTSLRSQSLFDGDRLIILENPSEGFNNYTLHPNPLTLVLWFDHEIDTKNFKGDVLFFPEAKEVSVFPFLDLLGQRDKRAFLALDKLKRAGYDSQYLITMILYLLRNLVAKPKGVKDFVKNKNAKMRINFAPDQLVNLYKSVLETDFKIKSGLLDEPQAEFLLVNSFLH
ncbi:hypothetical protein HYZ06_01370 [Candidatus Daviesbacteria bacterium]|nr:hypothetical protein [Candidatus Daviesbacteria bacterium]